MVDNSSRVTGVATYMDDIYIDYCSQVGHTAISQLVVTPDKVFHVIVEISSTFTYPENY